MTEWITAAVAFVAAWALVFWHLAEADQEMLRPAGIRLTGWHLRRAARNAFFAALVAAFLAWALAFVIMRGSGR